MFDWAEVHTRKRIRDRHFINQNGFCAYCRCNMNRKKRDRDDQSVTLEHIVPRVIGGRDCELHTIAICYRCNQNRSSMPLALDQMLGIFLFKGLPGLAPIGINLWAYWKLRLCIATRHIQTFAIATF